MNPRSQVGELLVKARLLTPEQLSAALDDLRRKGALPGRLVALLVERGDATERGIAQALSQELSLPLVALRYVDFSTTLTRLIPRRTAEQYTFVPVYVRRATRGPLTLYLAMDDPTWEEALFTAAVIAGMPVRPMVALRSEIRAAIETNYPKPPAAAAVSAPRPSPGPSRTRPPAAR